MSNYELAFIGAGNMAEAVARGAIKAGVLAAGQIIASDPADGRRKLFASLGVATTADNREAAGAAGRVLLAVKPQQMGGVLAELAPVLPASTLVISIAAGVSTTKIEAGLAGGRQHPVPTGRDIRHPASSRVIRVMPNTPALVGAGMAALVKGAKATDDDLGWARRLFDAVGASIVVGDERLMDAVTAVSGSGPAYFFYLIEWMVAGGCDEGLNPEDALELATQTCLGSARLLAETGESPRELRRRVTSPGGTTEAACGLLDARGVPDAIRDAVRAAAARSRELGK